MSTIAHMFLDSARRHADRDVLVMDDVTISYATLHRRACAVAAELIERGLEPGGRVGIVFPTCRRTRCTTSASCSRAGSSYR